MKNFMIFLKEWRAKFKDPIIKTYRIGVILKAIALLLILFYIPFRGQIFMAAILWFTIDYFVDKKIYRLTHDELGNSLIMYKNNQA